MSDGKEATDDVVAAMKDLAELPVMKEMGALDLWGKEQGLDSERRGNVVSAITMLVASASNVESARQYVHRLVDLVAGSSEMFQGLVAMQEGQGR